MGSARCSMLGGPVPFTAEQLPDIGRGNCIENAVVFTVRLKCRCGAKVAMHSKHFQLKVYIALVFFVKSIDVRTRGISNNNL